MPVSQKCSSSSARRLQLSLVVTVGHHRLTGESAPNPPSSLALTSSARATSPGFLNNRGSGISRKIRPGIRDRCQHQRYIPPGNYEIKKQLRLRGRRGGVFTKNDAGHDRRGIWASICTAMAETFYGAMICCERLEPGPVRDASHHPRNQGNSSLFRSSH
jgi:hypothetical protein